MCQKHSTVPDLTLIEPHSFYILLVVSNIFLCSIINIWENPSHWLSYFSKWLKPPTSTLSNICFASFNQTWLRLTTQPKVSWQSRPPRREPPHWAGRTIFIGTEHQPCQFVVRQQPSKQVLEGSKFDFRFVFFFFYHFAFFDGYCLCKQHYVMYIYIYIILFICICICMYMCMCIQIYYLVI